MEGKRSENVWAVFDWLNVRHNGCTFWFHKSRKCICDYHNPLRHVVRNL